MLMPKQAKLALALSFALAAVSPVFAQQTSSTLSGRVDVAGQPAQGAQVTILHTESGTVSHAVTDAQGRYSARGLRVGGPYTITIESDGQLEVRENVYLSLGEVNTINATLEETRTLETVQVVGSYEGDVFSPEKMGTGTSVSRAQLDALPSIERNIQDYVRMDPRITQTDKGRGEISAGGQNSRFNAIRIDGVSTNDPFGLEANNLPTLRQPVSMDAIEAIRVDLANYDVTITGATGAVIDAVTKSGTNDFSGSVYYLYRDQDWVRDNADGSPFNGFIDEETYGGTFGGPIVKDTLFFFFNYEKFTRAAPGPSYGPIGSSAANIVNITPEQIAEAQQIAAGWGMDVGTFTVPDGLKTDVEEYALKIDWNISDDHRASVRYSKMEQADANLPGIGSSSLSLNSYWYSHDKEFENIVAQLYSDWTDNFSTELKISQRDYTAIRNPLTDSRMPQIGISMQPGPHPNDPDQPPGSPYLNFGTEQFTHINHVETKQNSLFFAGTYYAGDHAIKFGLDWESNDVFNLFGRDLFGSYTFASLDHFRAGEYWNYTSRRPLPGQSFESIAADFDYETMGLFLQDSWMVTPNLTINYGLRVDRYMVSDRPMKNDLIEALYGLDNTATMDGKRLTQPRLGFNYNFNTERPTQLRGGIGLFQGASSNVWIGNSFQNAGFTPQIYGLNVLDYERDGGTRDEMWARYPFNPDPMNQPAPGNAQQMVVALMDSGLKQPSAWKANLAFDHELPWWGVVASVEGLWTNTHTGLHYEILGMGDPTAIGPDGRQIFYCNPANAGGGTRCNRNAGIQELRDAGMLPAGFENISGWGNDNVIYLRPTNKGESEQYTFSLSKPLTESWAWTVGYTYTDATEVNPLTSSQAHSNWDGRMQLNPNEPIAERANNEIRHRLSGAITWQKAFFGDYKTSVSTFFERRSGRPYSWTYLNDANGDMELNDLFYVPSGPGDVLFTGGAAMEQEFFSWLATQEDLSRYSGSVVPRNSSRSSWVTQFDVRISQELPGFFGDHKSEIWVDILNVGNLIDSDWGRIEEIGFPFGRRTAYMRGLDEATGKYIYEFNADNVWTENLYDNTGQSRWAVQVGFRYKF